MEVNWAPRVATAEATSTSPNPAAEGHRSSTLDVGEYALLLAGGATAAALSTLRHGTCASIETSLTRSAKKAVLGVESIKDKCRFCRQTAAAYAVDRTRSAPRAAVTLRARSDAGKILQIA